MNGSSGASHGGCRWYRSIGRYVPAISSHAAAPATAGTGSPAAAPASAATGGTR
ncbi:hypothetical protein GCM10027168_54320 [Streptomyces capparidis]